jgi:hypothetical protein
VRGRDQALDRALVGQQKPAGSDVRLPRVAGSIIADKLFGSAAALASEADEVGFVFPHLMGGYFHERAAVKANGIFASV